MRMRTAFLFALYALPFNLAMAGSYGMYEPKLVIIPADTSANRRGGIDLRYLDQMLDDLGRHASNYPTQFDSLQDRLRAVNDVKALSKVFEILVAGPESTPGILRRAGFFYSIGHNLDIQGHAERAVACFQRLLAMEPADPQGNFMFGAFLGGAGKAKESIPFLEKAVAGGISDANYSLGMSHLALGNKEKALALFSKYKAITPGDKSIDELIKSINAGQYEVKTVNN